MCKGAKPLITEDIYKLGNDTQSHNSSTLNTVPSSPLKQSDKCNTWRCDICKHVNSIGSKECVACNTSRYNEASVQEQLSSLTIGENELVPAAVNDQQRGQPNQKWSCPVCTYENWPKAMKCIMCLSIRNRISPVSSTNCINSPERELFVNSRTTEDNLNRSRKANIRRMDDSRCTSPSNNIETEKKLKQQRKLQRNIDRPWLNACMGVLNGDPAPVLAYMAAGGNPSRQLTQNEVTALGRPSAFDVGYTLVHLAIRFNREDMLATLLSHIEGSSSGIKRVPSYVAPDLAADIRRFFESDVRQRKSNFACPFVNEQTTFFLPAEIEDLPSIIQEQLFEEILDKDVQQQLEAHPPVINWSLEVTSHLGSRLYALWNRSAGDCLLDSVMQATWGVFDRESILRKAMFDALSHPHSGHMFYSRWREYETIQAMMMHFSLEETQWQNDWSALVALANQPGSSLEQLHVFVLAHILRRPIIIYGVKYVKSFRGENIGYAKFEGVYLPLLWEPNFCIKSPLALGYTRGHFSALVPMEPEAATSMNTHIKSESDLYVTFLPLMDHNHIILPVHFISQTEMGREERLLRQWLDVCVTDSGLLIAQQKLQQRPLLVAQMVEEWLNYYRRLAHMSIAPFHRPIPVQDYSSEGETDDE